MYTVTVKSKVRTKAGTKAKGMCWKGNYLHFPKDVGFGRTNQALNTVYRIRDNGNMLNRILCSTLISLQKNLKRQVR